MELWKGRFDQYDEESLLRIAYLRAVEWLGLSLFLAQPIAPILMIFFPAGAVIAGVILFSWGWALVRYRLLGIHFVIIWPKRLVERIELPIIWLLAGEAGLPMRMYKLEYRTPKVRDINLVRLADAIQWLVHLKWPISIGAGLYLVHQNRPAQATVAAFWPVLTLLLMSFRRVFRTSGLIGALEKSFLLALGFIPLTGDPADCTIDDFHRPGCGHLAPNRCYLCGNDCLYPIRSSTRIVACPACLERLVLPALEDARNRQPGYEELRNWIEGSLRPWLIGSLGDLLTELEVAPKAASAEELSALFRLYAPRLRLRGLITGPLEEALRSGDQ